MNPFKWIDKKIKNYSDEVSKRYLESAYNLTPVYTSANGTKFMTFKDDVLPYSRYNATLDAMNDAQLSMDRERQELYAKETLQALNAQDFNTAATLQNQLLATLDMLPEEKTLERLACALTVIDGEPEDEIAPAYQEMKKKIFAEDKKCRDFFLGFAYAKTPRYIEISTGSLVERMNKEKTARDLYTSILLRNQSNSRKG